MATQGPTTTAAMAGATPAGMTSRLAQMQMRFQQRQQQERDQRKVEMISTTKATASVATAAAHHHNGGSNGGSSSTMRSSTISAFSSTTTTTASSTTSNGATAVGAADLSASLGAGKVRQMFDERRHRVAGIDKSYPLQPIQQPQQQQQALGRTVANGGGSNVTNGNSAKGVAAAGLNNKTRVPPISANTKARLAMQQQRQQQQQENGNHVETFKAASFDDNENLLDDEKFPDTISFDDDLTLTPTPIVRKLPNVGKLSGQQQNVNSLKLKPVPGRTPTTTTTPSSTVKTTTSSSATKPMPKRTTPTASSSSAPAAPAQSSSSPSSANSAKSATSRASTTGAKSTPAPSRKPSAASSVLSATSAGTNRSLPDEPVPDGLARCTICSRNFAEDRIAKHREICQKTKNKKRKVYDTTKHRVLGTDAEKYVLQRKKVGAGASKKSISGPSTTAVKPAAAGADSKRKNDWRRKHEEFIQAIRAAKEMKAYLAKGGKLSDLPPPPPSENPDYVQCPHCSRRFNQTAAERHIPKCATMLHNKPKPTAKAKRF